MNGDNLAATDAIGVLGILPSRAAKTSFVTTASGRALYAHQMFCPRRCCGAGAGEKALAPAPQSSNNCCKM